MTSLDLLNQLRSAGVSVGLLGENLTLQAPAGVLTAALQAQVAAVKPGLIALLGRPKAGSHARPFVVHGTMPVECFFNEVCDGRMLRKLESYCCSKCGCWFVEA